MLDSGFFENQIWGALLKAWKGYVIAKNKDEFDKMLHYADIIQECQNDLGLEITSFPDIGKSLVHFYAMRDEQSQEVIDNKNNDYNYNNNQVPDEELTISTKKKDSLMIMPIVKILQMIIISQIDFLCRVY
jgi:hypothetical protein